MVTLTNTRRNLSNSKISAAVAVFAALAVALQILPVRVPAPYAPFLIYQIWEIPIVVALLIFGPVVGVLVAIVNAAGLIAIYPGLLPTGPVYNLIAVLSMLLGVYVVHKNLAAISSFRMRAPLATGVGGFLRVAVMSVVNYLLLPFPPPIGFGLPAEGVVATLPLIGFFNATVALYTVLVAEVVARNVSARMRLPAWAFRPTQMGYPTGQGPRQIAKAA